MNRFIVSLSFLMITSQLFCQNRVDITSDTSLNKVFNQTEIRGLESMIQYVDDMVLNRENITDVNEAYHQYFEEIAQTREYIVPFEENEKYKFLEGLDSLQFSSIWRFSYDVKFINTGDTIYRNLKNFKMLEIKPFSKYMDYLKDIGRNDVYFKNLQQEFDGAGNMMLNTSEWFPKNHMNFDFTIPKNRLWAAIYLLRREENTKMKLHRYLKNK